MDQRTDGWTDGRTELQIRRQLPFKYNIGQPKFVEDDSEIVMHLLARSTTENESAPDEAVESVPDAAGKLAPKEQVNAQKSRQIGVRRSQRVCGR